MSLLPVQGGLLQKHTSTDKHSGAKDVSGLRGEVRKKSHFPGRLHCEPLGLHPPGPLETLNHAWECLTQGRGELGYGPSISHRACHWPRGTPQYISLCPCETGLGPGTAAVWLALGCSSPQATKFRETARDSAQAQLGQILDQKISKKEEKNTLLSFLKSQRQKKKKKEENLGVGSKNRVLFMPSALTTTKEWANHPRHPSSQRLDSPSAHRSLSSPPSLESKQGNLSYLF